MVYISHTWEDKLSCKPIGEYYQDFKPSVKIRKMLQKIVFNLIINHSVHQHGNCGVLKQQR